MRPFEAMSDQELLAGAPQDLPVEQDREVDALVERFVRYRELDDEGLE